MTDYILVPVEPTQEMIDAALKSDHAEISPRKIVEQDYKAMLAAAPDFDRHVIAEVNENDDGQWADILPDRRVYLGQPLYAVMQPAPDVAALLDALTPQVIDWVRCGLAVNGRLQDGDHPALAKLRAALDACRNHSSKNEGA